ncbi:MAG: hypothetical protein NPIRA02_09030 [Nitrospirales bacterium]|nr:MAG: hypothetical protein NPIRA02_09030 [Nitrospirales bacterium]
MKRSGFTMMVLFFGAIGLLYVWMRVDLLRVGHDIEKLKQQELALQHRQEALQLQLSQLTAPQKIAKAAKDRFQLKMPEPGQIVMVASETAMAGIASSPHKALQVAHSY